MGKIKQMTKPEKIAPRKKVALELLHPGLGHRSIRSLMAGYTTNVWEDIELRIDQYPFCTSCKISSMNQKARSKNPLKSKSPFKWVFMDRFPAKALNVLISETNFSNYILNVDAYSKISKLYGINRIITEEVMDKLDMFQSRF